MTPVNREEHIRRVHELRSARTLGRAFEALRRMREANVPVTFAAVSRASGLSVGILRYHRESREAIERAREDYRARFVSQTLRGGGSAAELAVEIARLEEELGKVTAERDELYEYCFEPSWEYEA